MDVVKRKTYKCEWCGEVFVSVVAYSQGTTDMVHGFTGKKSTLSTQVRCPKCLNMIPTWEKIHGIKIRR